VRRSGIGVTLKSAQRDYALSRGVDLMVWTYDPLMAQNAHFNFNRLGVVVHEYERDVYGTSASPLHAGAPTDRFVARWWLRDSRVEARPTEMRAGVTGPEPESDGPRDTVALEAAGTAAPDPEPDAFIVNDVAERGGWLVPSQARLDADAGRLRVVIPPDFDRMLREAPDVARAWRLHSRDVFETYFARGYHAVAFTRTADGGGVYRLAVDSA
jgi:chorismate synthase